MKVNEVIHDVMSDLYWTTLGKIEKLSKLRKYSEINVNNMYCAISLILYFLALTQFGKTYQIDNSFVRLTCSIEHESKVCVSPSYWNRGQISSYI